MNTRTVLELVLAHVLESDVEAIADIVHHRRRHCHPAGPADAFDAGGDVDPIAENVTILDDHVAEVDADSELDAPVFGNFDVAALHFALHRKRTFDRVDHAWKFGEDPVPGELDDPPVALRNARLDDFAAAMVERGQRADLIGPHQAAVADHVGGHDC